MVLLHVRICVFLFWQDKHISQLPYHALTKDERLVYRGRMKVLQHMTDILRDCARTMLAKQLVELIQQADEGMTLKHGNNQTSHDLGVFVTYCDVLKSYVLGVAVLICCMISVEFILMLLLV